MNDESKTSVNPLTLLSNTILPRLHIMTNNSNFSQCCSQVNLECKSESKHMDQIMSQMWYAEAEHVVRNNITVTCTC